MAFPPAGRCRSVASWLGALVLAWLVAEATCRVFMGNLAVAPWDTAPGDGRTVALAAGRSVTYTGWFKRVPPVVHAVNALGYRGAERPTERTPGTLRVAVLGNSYAFGQAVPEDRSIPARLEALLGPALGRPVEVLNFGVPGLVGSEVLDQYRFFAHRWRPDVVLYLVDESDLQAPLARLVTDPTRVWLLANLYTWRLVYILAVNPFIARGGEVGPESWERYGNVLVDLRQAAADQGSRLGLVVLDDPGTAFGGLGPLADALGIPSLDIALSRHLDDIPHIEGEGHLTAEGNERVAERIARWLADTGLGLPRAAAH